jgi:cathepsin C
MFYVMKCYAKTFFFLMIIFQILHRGNADLPVHCLSAKIEGVWLVHLGDNSSDSDIKCGHKRPDQNLDHYDVDISKIFKKKYETIIKLERPNMALSLVDGSTQVGSWTMVYDEGFEFEIGDQVFFAFSKYLKIGKFSPANTDTEDTPGYKNVCEQTFVGKNKMNFIIL